MKRFLPVLLAILSGCSPTVNETEMGAQLVKSASSDEHDWNNIVAKVQSPSAPFVSNIEFVRKEGKSVTEILSALPDEYPYPVIFVADETTFKFPDKSCLVIDLTDDSRPRFRALPKTLAEIENNLSTSNMDFSEYASKAQETGVFRGF